MTEVVLALSFASTVSPTQRLWNALRVFLAFVQRGRRRRPIQGSLVCPFLLRKREPPLGHFEFC